MLDLMRRKKESIIIKVVFVVIVLSFVGTMFMVWGKGDSGGGGGRSGYAAKVNGATITLDEYQNSYQRLRNVYQQIYGQSLSTEMEKMLGLKKLALDSLIDNILIMKEAKSMGIKVSKEDVANAIAAMPTFQKDGAFSFDLYNQLLKGNRITAKDFEESQKIELMIKKAKESVKEKVKVSDDDALAQFRKDNDKLEIEYISFSPADVIGEVKLSDDDLKEYLQKNEKDFRTPEKASISYILVDPLLTAGNVSVTDEEVQTFYQKNIDRWQGKDGILPFEQVKEKAKSEALRQKAAKQSYEIVADTLFKNIKSGDLNIIASQLKAKTSETPLFDAANPPAQLAGEAGVIKKAMELKEGELGGPVETQKGIYVLKAKEKKASSVPPLQDIKPAVEKKAREAKAVELARKKAEEVSKQLFDKTGSHKLQASPAFGYSAKGDVPGIGIAPEMMDAVFKLTPAAPSAASPFKVGGRWYSVRLKNRIEAPRADFDKSKEQIRQRILPMKQEEALVSWTKELRSKAKIELNESLVKE